MKRSSAISHALVSAWILFAGLFLIRAGLFAAPPIADAETTTVTALKPSTSSLGSSDAQSDAGVIRSRDVELRSELFTALSDHPNHANRLYRFNLFPDAEYLVRINEVIQSGENVRVYSGTVENELESRVFLARSGDVFAGSVFLPNRGCFRILHLSGGRYQVTETDPNRPPICGSGNELKEKPARLAVGKRRSRPVIHSPAAAIPSPETVRTIELMTLYTPAARIGAGGKDGMLALIHLAVAEANAAFEQSQTGVQFRLVHVAEVDYSENGDLSSDLMHLSSDSDSYMNEIHVARDQHQADVVSLFVESGKQFAGVAYLRPVATRAFSVLMRRYATGYHLLAHELGHNFGCDHDFNNRVGLGQFSYSFGNRFEVEGQVYRTIMSYTPGFQIPYFSSPNITFKGMRTGIAEGEPGQADNVRTIRQTAARVDSYRGTKVTLISPPLNGMLTEGDSVELSADVASDEGPVGTVEFFAGAQRLGQADKPPYTTLWTNVPAGRNVVHVRAGIDGVPDAVSLETVVPVRPINDDFARRIPLIPSLNHGSNPLDGFSITATAALYAASGEPFEPQHFGSEIRSAWWEWTAPGAATARISTSSGGLSPPRIAVYKGNSLPSLQLVTKTAGASREVLFQVKPGETFNISLHGAPEAPPAVLELTMHPQPLNDDFMDATSIVPGRISGNTSGATAEPSEPVIGISASGHTIWFDWAPQISGRTEIVIASAQNPLADFAVFTGSTLPELVLVATSAQASTGFDVTAGTRYKIGVDGHGGTFELQLMPRTAPFNDHFARAALLVGTSAILSATQAYAATRELDEPIHGSALGGRSLWWSWRAPADGGIRFSGSAGPDESPKLNLAIYTGTSLTNLDPMAAHSFNAAAVEDLILPVEAGTDYLFALEIPDGIPSTRTKPQDAAIYFEFVGSPANDRFSNRTEHTSVPMVVTGTTLGATAEPDEPAHGGRPAQRSVWWSWTFPKNGLVAATIESSGAFLPRVSVYRGTFSSLALVADNRFGDRTGSYVAFEAEAGEPYHIAVDDEAAAFSYSLWIGYATRPHNDQFTQRHSIQAGRVSGASVIGAETIGSTIGATHERDELDHSGSGSRHSVWYTWRASSSSQVRILASGYNGWSQALVHANRISPRRSAAIPAPVIAVYTGETLRNLQLVAAGTGDLLLSPRANTTYQIAVDGIAGQYGRFALRIVVAPPNDTFSNAARLPPSGAFSFTPLALQAASRETYEPNHGRRSDGRSLWWTWTPELSGPYVISANAQSYDGFKPVVAVYSGSNLSGLTLVAEGEPGMIAFSAVGRTRYFIAVDFEPDTTLSSSESTRKITLRLDIQPSLGRPLRRSDGVVLFRIAGSSGRTVILEHSTDLVHWTPLRKVQLDDEGEFWFRETVRAELEQHFYRVFPSPGK